MENERIIMLGKRQPGLDYQIKIAKLKPLIYDNRFFKKLSELKFGDYSPDDLWFIEGINRDLPLFDKKEPQAIVSGYFDVGKIWWGDGSERESNKEYVGVRTNYEDIERVAEALLKREATQIIVGQEISQRIAIDKSLELKSNALEQRVKEVMALSKQEQEKEVRRLLAYQAGENK